MSLNIKNMSESNQNKTVKKRFLRKSGRTLVIKLKDESFDKKVFDTLTGLTSSSTTQSGAVFHTFDTKENALNSLKFLKNNHKENLSVKFAHYKVFFKLEGLEKESKYDEVRNTHVKFVNDNVDGEVLYYKLYMKDNKYLGCGDLTVDTKEAIDQLLSSDKHKTFELSNGMKGTFYRYNRLSKEESDQQTKTT